MSDQPYWHPLWKLIHDDHGLPLTDDECAQIAAAVDGCANGTEARVCADIRTRQRMGIVKYGTTVEANPLAHVEWLRHAYQETLDQAVYLRRAIEEIESQPNV